MTYENYAKNSPFVFWFRVPYCVVSFVDKQVWSPYDGLWEFKGILTRFFRNIDDKQTETKPRDINFLEKMQIPYQ